MSVSSVPPSGSTPLAFVGAILAGRYRLEEVVGYGGMGSVWRATHTGLGEQVAVKLVSANFARSKEALRRFDTEAKSAAKLRSRHVPHVFDNGVLEDGTPYLVMELLRGESLAARLGRHGVVPLPETVSILEQCCRALTRAHSLGIVHRDIKPENVYLAQSVDDDGYIVKVLDFGIAKVTSSLSDDGRSSTRTGTLLGTPLYMSPEQARGLRTIDSRTDLYSLGLVTFTMLTGRLPFSGETLGDLLLQICSEPLPKLRAAAPALPPAMEDWFQKACARQPDDRYPTAQAFIEALRVAAGISRRSDSFAERNPSLPGLAAGLTGPEAATLDPAGPLPSTTTATTMAADPARTRRTRWVWVVASGILGLAVAPVVVLVTHGRSAPNATPSSQSETSSGMVTTPPQREGGAGVSIVPIASPSVPAPSSLPSAITAPPNDEKPAVNSWRPPPRPTGGTAPPVPVAKPTATPRTPSKSTGAIDLGY
jgi:eukaryotic-like serine/threonine-protein kinase